MAFGVLDWMIVVAYLIGSIGIGVWARKYVEDMTGYIVAGRRVRVSLGVATLVATELGTVTFVYFGELGYVSGFACFFLGIAAFVAFVVVGKTGFIIEGLRKYKVMTIPEFYELRYSRPVRLIGGILLFLGGVLNMGIFLKFDGIFLTEVMGFGPEALAVIMAIMLLVVVLYTIVGGMVSIVVTDFMQFVVLAVGMLVATAAVLWSVDLVDITTAVERTFGDSGFDPLVNPRFGWTFIIWILLSTMAAGALWQPGTSKALSSESPEVAKKVFFYAGLTYAGRAMVPMFWGVAALAYFGPGLDSPAAMPRLLGHVVPGGFLGLLVAGLLAASMSTYSSYLLAWSSVLARDVLGSMRKTDFSERATVTIIRISAGVIGVFLLVFGLLYKIPDTAFQYLSVTGAIYTAGALGAVVAGLYWPRANSVGAYASLILGAIGPLGFLLLEKSRDALPGYIQFLTDVNVAGLLSFVLAALGMVVGSLVSARSCPPKRLPVEVPE
jgi:SSS family solute:Na+ symporter